MKRLLGLALLVVAACGAPPPSTPPPATTEEPPVQPAPETPAPKPARSGVTALEDLNPDPNVVEVKLTAAPGEWNIGGRSLHGLSYNGLNPGPLLEAKLGDTIIVHFTNGLGVETTIHWHGLRVPAAMDGVDAFEKPVSPGATFDYVFEAKDVGFFWYHPHVHAEEQIELGLYGGILVHAPDEPFVAIDQPLVLDDVLLDSSSQVDGLDPAHLSPPSSMGHAMSNADMMMGRLGNLLLANGRANTTFSAVKNGWALFRVVNAANGRYFNLALEGHTLTVVGLDEGFIGKPYDVKRLVVAPGERYLVLVHMTGDAGKRYRFLNDSYGAHAAGMGMDPMPQTGNPLATLAYPSSAVVDDTPAPKFPVVGAPKLQEGAVTHTWVTAMTNEGHAIDGQVWPNVPVLSYPANGKYTFVVKNDFMDGHPWHIHGQRFQVLAVNGQTTPLVWGWKDTVQVPPNGSVTLATELDNPGRWMYHCHILEHAMAGMMAELQVK